MKHSLLALLCVLGVSHAETPPPPAGMVLIPGGEYTPLYAKGVKLRRAKPFFMDVTQVTNAQFLDFVKAHPEWQRSKVKRTGPAISNSATKRPPTHP